MQVWVLRFKDIRGEPTLPAPWTIDSTTASGLCTITGPTIPSEPSLRLEQVPSDELLLLPVAVADEIRNLVRMYFALVSVINVAFLTTSCSVREEQTFEDA